MGMSASQARLLALEARQSNLEYQGQQINQERSILSQQCTDLYNSLLSMTVPTPPSTQDYTTVEYSGVQGTTTYKFDASDIKPGKDGGYNLTLGFTDYGNSLAKNNGYASVTSGRQEVKGNFISAGGTDPTTGEAVTITKDDLANLYVVDQNNNITPAQAGVDYAVDANGNVTLLGSANFFLANPQGQGVAYKGGDDTLRIEGEVAMTMEEYKATFDENTMITYNGYCDAIENSGLKDKNGEPYGPEDFMVYIKNGQPHFALATDARDNNTCLTYDYIANGAYTKNVTYENSKLTFDPSSGRITSIEIPNMENGEIVSWTTINVEAKTVTDNNAYNDAYAQYEYEQYLYDRKQQEINAKTEIIQQQDRNLELKLQRLDNERTQITTEIEAVEKVINDNIESTYKTFSG